MDKLTVDIIIPVYNEESTLKVQVTKLAEFINKIEGVDISIVIADNGSNDKTPEIGESIQNQFKNIQFLRIGEKGVGLALKKAWQGSSADLVGCMDLDLSTDINQISTAIEKIKYENFDLVYASRLHKLSKVIGRKYIREVTSRIFNFLIRKYLNVQISDAMCGFIFLKREKLEFLFKNGVESNKWFFQAEVLIVSDWYKFKIYEMPVKWEDDPNSKVKISSLALEYLKAMQNLKKNFYPKEKR